MRTRISFHLAGGPWVCVVPRGGRPGHKFCRIQSLDVIRNKGYNSRMMTYATLQSDRREFLALTGLTLQEFQLLLNAFTPAYERRYPKDRTLASDRNNFPFPHWLGSRKGVLLDSLRSRSFMSSCISLHTSVPSLTPSHGAHLDLSPFFFFAFSFFTYVSSLRLSATGPSVGELRALGSSSSRRRVVRHSNLYTKPFRQLLVFFEQYMSRYCCLLHLITA